MKRWVKLLAVAAAAAVMLSGCTPPAAELPASEPEDSGSSLFQQPINAEEVLSGEPEAIYPFDPNNEPPISPELQGCRYLYQMSLPEFLNEEQKQLYRRAYAFYSTVHKNFYMLVYRFPLEDGSYAFPEEIERIDGVWYSVSNGRYQTWEEYRTALLSVFTEGWFQEHMEGNPGYLIRDGKLLCLQADIGYNATFKGTGTNTFEQLEQTENRIDFLLIEHYDTYNPQFPKFDETPPFESDLEWGDDYSIARQITLVKTEAGWRFDVFSCEN